MLGIGESERMSLSKINQVKLKSILIKLGSHRARREQSEQTNQFRQAPMLGIGVILQA